MSRFEFKTNCIASAPETAAELGAAITEMEEAGREITFRTFFKYVDLKTVEAMLGYDYALRLKDDYHVSYHKSRFRGEPCYYLLWSMIDFVFVEAKK